MVVPVYSHTPAELLVFSSPPRTAGCLRAQDRPDGFAGPLLALLAADPHLWLPVSRLCSLLHAGVQSHVLSALHTRQHFPGEKFQVRRRASSSGFKLDANKPDIFTLTIKTQKAAACLLNTFW